MVLRSIHRLTHDVDRSLVRWYTCRTSFVGAASRTRYRTRRSYIRALIEWCGAAQSSPTILLLREWVAGCFLMVNVYPLGMCFLIGNVTECTHIVK